MDFIENEYADEKPEACAKDLKKYFFVIAVAAVLILIATYWYNEYYKKGVGMAQPADAPMTDTAGPPKIKGPMAVAAKWLGMPQNWGGAPVNQPNAQPQGQPRQAASPRPGFPFNQAKAVQAASMGGGFSKVAMAMRKSVVNVSVRKTQMGGGGPDPKAMPAEPGLKFANPSLGRSFESIGSGVIVRNDGYIISNYHVVRGGNAVYVTVFDDFGTERYRANVLKLDESLDLALLKIKPKAPLTPAVLGDSNRVAIADEVLAIGSPFGLDQTVSRGIVSAQRKSLVIEGVTHNDLIQTDAAINQGNSGGPLVNRTGKVIGVNTAIYTPTGAFSGVGFAIPANAAKKFALEEVTFIAGMKRKFGARAITAAQQKQAGPPIAANAPPPGSHNDGRNAQDCAACHQMTGASVPVAAAMAPPPQQAGPPISANAPPPGTHNDGRNAQDCATCHQISGAVPVAMAGPNGAAGANPAVGAAGPVITANQPSPPSHADGRNDVDCETCHQIVAGGPQGVPVAVAPAPGTYSFARPPTSLAMNLAAVKPGGQGFAQGGAGRQGQGPVGGRPHEGFPILGSALLPITESLGQRLGHPDGKGVFVNSVLPQSPMAKAQLRIGDILLKVNGKRVSTPREVAAIMTKVETGENVRLSILRQGKRNRLKLKMVALQPGTGRLQVAEQRNQQAALVQQQGRGQAAMQQGLIKKIPKPGPAAPAEFNWLGMEIETFMKVQPKDFPNVQPMKGAQAAEIIPGSRAARAGLQDNDVILAVNNQPTGTARQLDKAIKAATGLENILLQVARNGSIFHAVVP